MLPSRASRDSLRAAEIGDVDKSIVEGRIDVGDTPALWSFLLRHLLALDRFGDATFDPLYLTYLRVEILFRKMRN